MNNIKPAQIEARLRRPHTADAFAPRKLLEPRLQLIFLAESARILNFCPFKSLAHGLVLSQTQILAGLQRLGKHHTGSFRESEEQL